MKKEMLVDGTAGPRYECRPTADLSQGRALSTELIQNREIVAAVWAEVGTLGQLLVCHGCDDVEAVIVAFLVDEQSEQAWALCGSCVRALPASGMIG